MGEQQPLELNANAVPYSNANAVPVALFLHAVACPPFSLSLSLSPSLNLLFRYLQLLANGQPLAFSVSEQKRAQTLLAALKPPEVVSIGGGTGDAVAAWASSAARADQSRSGQNEVEAEVVVEVELSARSAQYNPQQNKTHASLLPRVRAYLTRVYPAARAQIQGLEPQALLSAFESLDYYYHCT